MGRGLALDARARGIGIMLGPGVNIYRSALCGRNFEYYGEDPVLASAIACGYIEGMQQNGVIATIKHFAANNQEYRRHATNSVVDERTLRELYFPVFKDAVQKAGVGAVMTSYNPLNGIHSAENRWLITDVLRKEWGFDGIVMSDWTSTYTTLGCMESGLDLEMPKGYWLNYKMIRELLDRGIVHERQLDEKCVHILSTLIRFGLLDRPAVDSALPLDNEECRRIAYATALDRAALKRVAVIGPNADRIPFGGGSGEVTPIEGCSTTLFSGLCAVAGREHVDTIRFGADGSFDEKAVSRASAVVVSVGFTKETEGEGFDRTFSLPEGQDELIRRVAGLNDRVVVVVNSGGEVAMPWLDEVEAVVMAWYPGQPGFGVDIVRYGVAVGTSACYVLGYFGRESRSSLLRDAEKRNRSAETGSVLPYGLLRRSFFGIPGGRVGRICSAVSVWIRSDLFAVCLLRSLHTACS